MLLKINLNFFTSKLDEVKTGLAKALETDSKVIVAIGEAATKFKSCVDDL